MDGTKELAKVNTMVGPFAERAWRQNRLHGRIHLLRLQHVLCHGVLNDRTLEETRVE